MFLSAWNACILLQSGTSWPNNQIAQTYGGQHRNNKVVSTKVAFWHCSVHSCLQVVSDYGTDTQALGSQLRPLTFSAQAILCLLVGLADHLLILHPPWNGGTEGKTLLLLMSNKRARGGWDPSCGVWGHGVKWDMKTPLAQCEHGAICTLPWLSNVEHEAPASTPLDTRTSFHAAPAGSTQTSTSVLTRLTS